MTDNNTTISVPIPTAPEANANAFTWYLLGLTPELGELSIALTDQMQIGRSDSNDVILASSQVTRRHALITRQDEGYYIQDLGSANGTFVNGKRLSNEAIALQLNDEVAFANLVFMVNANEALDYDDIIDNLVAAMNDTEAQPLASMTTSATTATQPAIDLHTSLDSPIVSTQSSKIEQTDPSATATTEVYAVAPNNDNTVSKSTSAQAVTSHQPEAINQSQSVVKSPITADKEPVLNTNTVSTQPSPAPIVDTSDTQSSNPSSNRTAIIAVVIVVLLALLIAAALFL